MKGKIVLIGPDFAGQDQHTLPFTVGKEKATFFPGVFVHAQALAQILDGRFFHNWSSGEQFLLLFCVWPAGCAPRAGLSTSRGRTSCLELPALYSLSA